MAPQGQVPQALLLRWNTSYLDTSPTTRACQVQLAQGSLQMAIICSPDDMERMAADLLNCARRAKTDLQQASSIPDLSRPNPNGRPKQQGG